MKQNSLIEIGSKANVILRFKIPKKINGVNYEANEPFIFLKDVIVLINYSNQDKTGTAAKTIVASSDIKPRSVSIGGVPFSRKILSLLAEFDDINLDYNSTTFQPLIASDNKIFLLDDMDSTKPFFVYETGFTKVEGVAYDSTFNTLESENFNDSEEYLISFSSVKKGTKFDLKKPSSGYMSLEIQGIGNIDKKTKNVMMYFDKVSLNSIIEFSFLQDDRMNIPLEFHIIDDKNNYIVFED